MSNLLSQTKNTLTQLGITSFKDADNYISLSCPFKENHEFGDRSESFVMWPKIDFCKCYSCGYRATVLDFFETYADYVNKTLDISALSISFALNFEEEFVEENPELDQSILDGFSNDLSRVGVYLASRKNPIDINYIEDTLYFDQTFNNLMCPVYDVNNVLRGATGRSIVDRRHHHYFGFFTSNELLGVHKKKHRNVLLCEGLTDYLNASSKIKQLNLPLDPVASFTCSLSDLQAISLLDNWDNIYLGYDLDDAGLKGRDKAKAKLTDSLKLYEVSWEYRWDDKKKDIGDLNLQEFSEIFGNISA